MKCGECGKTPANLKCGGCEMTLCKSCSKDAGDADLTYFTKLPVEASHGAYCTQCFAEKLLPVLEKYEEIMRLAENVDVYMKDQGKETRLYKRSEKPIVIKDCADRDETLMRMAFRTAELGYGILVDVDLTYDKVFDHAYQTSVWKGVGQPVKPWK